MVRHSRRRRAELLMLISMLASLLWPALIVRGQLPDDIQQELERSIAEQARLDALRRQQQQQGQLTTGGQKGAPTQQRHDPNNYSYQQVSPPIQYSYYQPFGDAAAPPQPANQQNQAQQQQPINIDLNNLNFDIPDGAKAANAARQPAASQQQQHMRPSFTGAGGLPVLQPVAGSQDNSVPVGQAPLAPQARVQQGPPLTEADFRDITGGENYGAPGGNDFGLGDAGQANPSRGSSPAANSDTDAQLAEFGMPTGQQQRQRRPQAASQQMNIPDFGAFGPIGGGSAAGGGGGASPRQDMSAFGNLAEFGLPGGRTGGNPQRNGNSEFDFASQPSSRQASAGSAAGSGDPSMAALNGGAPGSLQSLLGAGFPGLGGNSGGLENFAQGGNNPQQARQDDNSMDIANLGDKSDQFSGADLGGFEQPGPQNDQDFNYAAAASQQPRTVPYPDSNPQAVGTLLALTQPQSLTQTRYNALPDKGTYQDYPAYASGGNDFSLAAERVDATPAARRPAPGRYSMPSANALAPEVRQALVDGGQAQFEYSQVPEQLTENSHDGQFEGHDNNLHGHNTHAYNKR